MFGDDENLGPVAVIVDGDGAVIEVYADGSYCTKDATGRVLPSGPVTV
ncbi:hypothetical protein [Arthrobacter ginkgonis]